MRSRARSCIRQTQRRIRAFIRAKGSVCAGERDRWEPTEPTASGAFRVLPGLYLFGGNSYLLAGDGGEGLIIDPTLPKIKTIETVMAEAGIRTISATTATHYHRDHSDGLDWVRKRFGASVWLHPWVAEPLAERNRYDIPWLTETSVRADRLLPEEGIFDWNRFRFHIRPFPGQTWWHCAFDTEIAGRRVLFSGDNFQPPTRWNGTGGFCSFNGSRFSEGFTRSAQAALSLSPDLICNGHGCVYAFHAAHYRRTLRWSAQAEEAVRALCASGLEDYDCRAMSWVPFRSEVKAGETVHLSFQVRNHRETPRTITTAPALPERWATSPAHRRMRVPPGSTRKTGFQIPIPGDAVPGRHIIAATVRADTQNLGEAAVAFIDIQP